MQKNLDHGARVYPIYILTRFVEQIICIVNACYTSRAVWNAACDAVFVGNMRRGLDVFHLGRQTALAATAASDADASLNDADKPLGGQAAATAKGKKKTPGLVRSAISGGGDDLSGGTEEVRQVVYEDFILTFDLLLFHCYNPNSSLAFHVLSVMKTTPEDHGSICAFGSNPTRYGDGHPALA